MNATTDAEFLQEKTILRKGYRSNFTIINNDILQNKSLSWKAKGLLCYLLSLPDYWRVNFTHLEKQAKDGMDSLRSGMKELRENRYLKLVVKRSPKGQILQHIWIIYDSPYPEDQKEADENDISEPENPEVENPFMDTSFMDIPPLVNTKATEQDLKEKDKDIAQTPKPLRKEMNEWCIYLDIEKMELRGITDRDFKDWEIAYSGVNFPQEWIRIRQWILSNPKKAIPKKKWRTFINNWFQSSLEKSTNKTAYQQGKSSTVDRRTKNVDGSPVDSAHDGRW